MSEKRHWFRLLLFGALVILLLVVPLALLGGPSEWADFFMDRQIHPCLFVGLMLVLPLFGVPITAFLLVVGIKFGVVGGLTITTAIFGLHLIITYLLTHSMLRPYIWKILERTRFEIPEVRARHRLIFSLVFMAVPGLPYTVKNFSLALLNVPFGIFLPVAWGVNLLLALPFIGFGHSIITNPKLALVFLALLAILYFVIYKIWQKNREE